MDIDQYLSVSKRILCKHTHTHTFICSSFSQWVWLNTRLFVRSFACLLFLSFHFFCNCFISPTIQTLSKKEKSTHKQTQYIVQSIRTHTVYLCAYHTSYYGIHLAHFYTIFTFFLEWWNIVMVAASLTYVILFSFIVSFIWIFFVVLTRHSHKSTHESKNSCIICFCFNCCFYFLVL